MDAAETSSPADRPSNKYAEKTFYCETCELSIMGREEYLDHLASVMHRVCLDRKQVAKGGETSSVKAKPALRKPPRDEHRKKQDAEEVIDPFLRDTSMDDKVLGDDIYHSKNNDLYTSGYRDAGGRSESRDRDRYDSPYRDRPGVTDYNRDRLGGRDSDRRYEYDRRGEDSYRRGMSPLSEADRSRPRGSHPDDRLARYDRPPMSRDYDLDRPYRRAASPVRDRRDASPVRRYDDYRENSDRDRLKDPYYRPDPGRSGPRTSPPRGSSRDPGGGRYDQYDDRWRGHSSDRDRRPTISPPRRTDHPAYGSDYPDGSYKGSKYPRRESEINDNTSVRSFGSSGSRHDDRRGSRSPSRHSSRSRDPPSNTGLTVPDLPPDSISDPTQTAIELLERSGITDSFAISATAADIINKVLEGDFDLLPFAEPEKRDVRPASPAPVPPPGEPLKKVSFDSVKDTPSSPTKPFYPSTPRPRFEDSSSDEDGGASPMKDAADDAMRPPSPPPEPFFPKTPKPTFDSSASNSPGGFGTPGQQPKEATRVPIVGVKAALAPGAPTDQSQPQPISVIQNQQPAGMAPTQQQSNQAQQMDAIPNQQRQVEMVQNQEQQGGLIQNEQQMGMVPNQQQSGVMPNQQQQQMGMMPNQQQGGMMPNQQSTDMMQNQQMGMIQNQQQQGGMMPNQMGMMQNQQGGMMPNQQGGMMPNQQGGMMSNQQGGMMPNQQGGMMPNQQGGMMPNQQSGMMPNQQSGIMPNQQGGMMPNQQGGMMPNQQGGMMPNQQGGMMQNQFQNMNSFPNQQRMPFQMNNFQNQNQKFHQIPTIGRGQNLAVNQRPPNRFSSDGPNHRDIGRNRFDRTGSRFQSDNRYRDRDQASNSRFDRRDNRKGSRWESDRDRDRDRDKDKGRDGTQSNWIRSLFGRILTGSRSRFSSSDRGSDRGSSKAPILPPPSSRQSKSEMEKLMRLVNAPRSYKQRLQIAKILRAHQQRTNTRFRLSKPGVGSSTSDPIDGFKAGGEINLDDLSERVKLEIAALLEHELANEEPPPEPKPEPKPVVEKKSGVSAEVLKRRQELLDTKQNQINPELLKDVKLKAKKDPALTIVAKESSGNLTDVLMEEVDSKDIKKEDGVEVKKEEDMEVEGEEKGAKRRRDDESPDKSTGDDKADEDSKRRKVSEDGTVVVEADPWSAEVKDGPVAAAIMTITLNEEDVRNRLATTNAAIVRLEALMRRTLQQLGDRQLLKKRLLREEMRLRARRLRILKEKVDEDADITDVSSVELSTSEWASSTLALSTSESESLEEAIKKQGSKGMNVKYLGALKMGTLNPQLLKELRTRIESESEGKPESDSGKDTWFSKYINNYQMAGSTSSSIGGSSSMRKHREPEESLKFSKSFKKKSSSSQHREHERDRKPDYKKERRPESEREIKSEFPPPKSNVVLKTKTSSSTPEPDLKRKPGRPKKIDSHSTESPSRRDSSESSTNKREESSTSYKKSSDKGISKSLISSSDSDSDTSSKTEPERPRDTNHSEVKRKPGRPKKTESQPPKDSFKRDTYKKPGEKTKSRATISSSDSDSDTSSKKDSYKPREKTKTKSRSVVSSDSDSDEEPTPRKPSVSRPSFEPLKRKRGRPKKSDLTSSDLLRRYLHTQSSPEEDSDTERNTKIRQNYSATLEQLKNGPVVKLYRINVKKEKRKVKKGVKAKKPPKEALFVAPPKAEPEKLFDSSDSDDERMKIDLNISDIADHEDKHPKEAYKEKDSKSTVDVHKKGDNAEKEGDEKKDGEKVSEKDSGSKDSEEKSKNEKEGEGTSEKGKNSEDKMDDGDGKESEEKAVSEESEEKVEETKSDDEEKDGHDKGSGSEDGSTKETDKDKEDSDEETKEAEKDKNDSDHDMDDKSSKDSKEDNKDESELAEDKGSEHSDDDDQSKKAKGETSADTPPLAIGNVVGGLSDSVFEKFDSMDMDETEKTLSSSGEAEPDRDQEVSVKQRAVVKQARVEAPAPLEGSLPLQYNGHSAAIHDLFIWEDFLFTASEDNSARKFNIATGECLAVYEGHKKGVQSIVVASGFGIAPMVFTGSFDNSIRGYNVETSEREARHKFAHRVLCLHHLGGKLYIGLGNGSVACLDIEIDKVVETFRCAESPIKSLATGREGPRTLLVAAANDCTVTVRDITNGLLIRTIDGHTKAPMAVKVVNGKVYTAATDKTVLIHDLNTGDLLETLRHKGIVTSVCVHNKLLYTAGYEGLVRCYNLKTYELYQLYYGAGNGMVTSMVVYDNKIITANRDGLIESYTTSPTSQWPCQFGLCSLVFGLRVHLEHHVVNDHLLPNQETVRCLWTDCTEFLSTKNGAQAAIEHFAKHFGGDTSTSGKSGKAVERSKNQD